MLVGVVTVVHFLKWMLMSMHGLDGTKSGLTVAQAAALQKASGSVQDHVRSELLRALFGAHFKC